jgi:hypothetical protein
MANKIEIFQPFLRKHNFFSLTNEKMDAFRNKIGFFFVLYNIEKGIYLYLNSKDLLKKSIFTKKREIFVFLGNRPLEA